MSDQEYRRGSHTIYDIRYHLVRVTKYRYHVSAGEVARRVRELVRQTCEAMDVRIVKGHVSKDHVHILVSCPTTVSPAQLTGVDQGSVLTEGAGGVCAPAEAILGTAFLGPGIFLRGRPERVTDEQIQDYIEGHDEEPPDPDFTIGD